ncbi:WbqC family protein [Moheibacter sp.]|uniref:WbqC family protein n=1 Tax=Moheibacter sp. TaxID=1965316 RepID=UPI003C7868C4
MIFPAFYFGPVSYFAELLKADEYRFEANENFPKQTYRNRCYIQGANGKLRLAIPTQHNGARVMKDIQVSDDHNWQKEHFKSLVSAYKSSPYFEFYEDDLLPIFEKKEKFLLELNLKTIEFIASKLKLEIELNLTDQYEFVDESIDFRNRFNAKTEPVGNFPEYFQVFDDKFDFMPDLSILDLLCNEGPKSATYLQELSNKK